MELTVCAILLILASFQPIWGSPHGYGVKNGAAAQAVAGASAGAFSGTASLPIALPHGGAGFSGSYSKAASSSFAASSASSSSSSFSFSGSGVQGNILGCASGICQNGNGPRSPNGNSNGYYANNGAANGLVAAQAGASAGTQSYNNDGTATLCSGGNCPNKNDVNCKGPNCTGVPTSVNNCESGQCGSTSSSEPSIYGNEPKNKCTSGQCNVGELSEVQGSVSNSNNNLNTEEGSKCTFGNCGITLPQDALPSNPSNKCASGQCDASSGAGKPSTNGDNSNYPNSHSDKCTSGQCEPPTDVASVPSAYGDNSYPNSPNEKCTSGRCEPTSATGNSPTAHKDDSYPHNPKEKCSSGQCIPSFNVGTLPSAYSSNNNLNNPHNKCTSGQCGASLPENEKSTPNYDSSEKCVSGQCKLSKISSAANPNIYDIPINIASSSTQPVNYPSNNLVNTPGSTTKSKPGCSFGNCQTTPTSNPTLSYEHGTTNTYSIPNNSNQKPAGCGSAGCSHDAYNPHASAPSSASASAYNKPVTYLTAPKYDPSCTSHNCQLPAITPGYYPSGLISPITGINLSPSNTKNPICTNGNCAHTQSPNPGSYSPPLSPNQPNIPSGPRCTSPNCDFNSPENYGTSQNVPSSSSSNYKPSNFYPTPSQGSPLSNLSPNSPNYHPTTQPITQSGLSSYKPAYPQGHTPATAPGHKDMKEGDSIPPFVPLSPPNLSNCDGSVCSGNSPKNPNNNQNTVSYYPSTSSGQALPMASSKYPGTYNNGVPNLDAKNPEKSYQGGFGAPSGLLKPNDFTIPSSTPITNGKPTTSVGHHSVPCTNGNCNVQYTQSEQGHRETVNSVGKPLGTYNLASCSTGSCGPHSGVFNLNGADAAATAVASAKADAIVYTGGFGGPPGLLKPYDDGKSTGGSIRGLDNKNPSSVPGLNNGYFAANGAHDTTGKETVAGAGAQASAVAGASAGSFGISPYAHSTNAGHGSTGGCGGGCHGGGSHSTGRNLDFNGSHPKGGHQDDLYGGISGAGAAAKSISFGSSFASAHASSGASTKGGYGRR